MNSAELRWIGSPQGRTIPSVGTQTRTRNTQADHSFTYKQGTNTNGGITTNLSNGEWTAGSTSTFIDVNDPSTQRLLTRVPETTHEDMVKIVDGAQAAWESEWRDSSVLRRQAVMLK